MTTGQLPATVRNTDDAMYTLVYRKMRAGEDYYRAFTEATPEVDPRVKGLPSGR